MLAKQQKDFLGDYDFSRTDKFYSLKIPSYSIEEGVVLYLITLKDLITNQVYSCKQRFKQIKNIHSDLQKLDFQLPPFPKTHFWTKTNNSPELINKRKNQLQNYLAHVINDPYLRGYQQVKKIIKMCKQGNQTKRKSSFHQSTQNQQKSRSLSWNKSEHYLIPRDQWTKYKRLNTVIN